MIFRPCRGPGASRLKILLSKLCSRGVALCRCPPHCRPWSPWPSHTCSLLQVQIKPKPQPSDASHAEIQYSTYCSPSLFNSIFKSKVSLTLSGFPDSPDYSFILWCGGNYNIILYRALWLILAICPAAKTMAKSVVLRMRNSSTGSNRQKRFRPGSGPLHVNMVSDPASVLRLHLTDCFVLLSHVKEVL